MLFLEITVDLVTKVTKQCIKLIQLPCFYLKLDHKNYGAEILLEMLTAVHPALSRIIERALELNDSLINLDAKLGIVHNTI